MPGLTRAAPRAAGDRGNVSAAEFAALMAALGPFEPKPQIAVAVSGGSDSLALAILTDRWVRGRRGRVVALTVDHGLRPESAAEARQVGAWLRSRGIEHHVLRWRPGAIAAGLQAAARAARYRLLTDWCGAHGVLHLALAHQRDDQAETLALRLARGSGLDGLAAMSRVAETADVRLLRPLLDCSRERLQGFLARQDQAWVDDPSNRDDRFARVRVRVSLAADRVGTAELARSARRLGRARAAMETATAALLARAAAAHPAGFCVVDASQLRDAPPEMAFRALARVLMCVGGATYPPRRERLERLFADVLGAGSDGKRRTLAGCLVIPRGASLQIVREARGRAAAIAIRPGEDIVWDGRFHVARARGCQTSIRLDVAPLGPEGWRDVRSAVDGARSRIPAEAAAMLPALRDAIGLRAVPHLGYERREGAARAVRVGFRPAQPLAGAVFSVV